MKRITNFINESKGKWTITENDGAQMGNEIDVKWSDDTYLIGISVSDHSIVPFTNEDDDDLYDIIDVNELEVGKSVMEDDIIYIRIK